MAFCSLRRAPVVLEQPRSDEAPAAAEEVAPPMPSRRRSTSRVGGFCLFGVDGDGAVVRLDGGRPPHSRLERLPVVPSADANAPEELGGWFRPIVERLAMDVAALCEEGGA